MTVPRIYFPQGVTEGNRCELGKDHLRYVKSVLRMKKEDRLILFDGAGWEYKTIIKGISEAGIVLEVIEKSSLQRGDVRICLMQALPKANKMDFIIQKATELGVERIIPFQSARAVPRISHEKIPLKIARWQNVAIEAARQCGRPDIPEINGILSFEETILWTGRDTLKLIFWEEESGKTIKQALRDKGCEEITDISVVVGPEGGFAKEEVVRAVENGFTSVSLGRQVLKVETAVLAILSIIQYEKGIFSKGYEEGISD